MTGELNQRTYMHTCKTHGHTQQCGEGWGGEGGRGENGGYL